MLTLLFLLFIRHTSCCWDSRSYCVGTFLGVGSLTAQGRCRGLKVVASCSKRALPIYFFGHEPIAGPYIEVFAPFCFLEQQGGFLADRTAERSIGMMLLSVCLSVCLTLFFMAISVGVVAESCPVHVHNYVTLNRWVFKCLQNVVLADTCSR